MKEKHKADRNNAVRENTRTGDNSAKIHLKSHTGRGEMAETREKLLRPRPLKAPEKLYEYPRKVQRTMAIRQLLRGDLFGPVTAQLQVAQDAKEKQKTDPTKAGRENTRTGEVPDKICKKPQLRLREMCSVGLLTARGVAGLGSGNRLTNAWKALCCV